MLACSLPIHVFVKSIWAVTCDFKQCGILTSVDGPVQPHFKFRNSKWYSASSLALVEYSSDEQSLWSDCAYAQADLRLCPSHIPHCWKSHVTAHIMKEIEMKKKWMSKFHLNVCLFKVVNFDLALNAKLSIHKKINSQTMWFLSDDAYNLYMSVPS